MAPDDPQSYEWLDRYLSGEGTADERASVRQRIDADPVLAAVVASVERTAGAAPRTRRTWDVDTAWDRVHASGRARRASRAAAVGMGRVPSRRFSPRSLGLAALAAGIALAIMPIAARLRLGDVVGTAGSGRQYATASGERQRITLPDGTQFTLAPASTLRLGARYGAASRDVYLEGEAYFAVAHDAAHPFAVHAGGSIARDIGTQFDVRAYATDGGVRVAVAEGIVAVGAGSGRDRTVLRVDDVAMLRDTTVGVTHGADVTALTSWTDGRLTFADTPVADAARDMSRWYGVSIRMGDAVVGRRHISVVLTSPSADAALAALAPAVGARVVRHGDAYVLFATPLPQQR